MSDILAENLSGKSVMGSDGTELGLLYNITMDLKSGRYGCSPGVVSQTVANPQFRASVST